jgi:hypothetical protein
MLHPLLSSVAFRITLHASFFRNFAPLPGISRSSSFRGTKEPRHSFFLVPQKVHKNLPSPRNCSSFVPRNEGTPAFVFFSSTNSAQKSALASELFILCSAEQFPHAPSSIVGFYTWHWITWRDPIRSLFVFFSLKRITCSRFSPPHFNNLKIFPSCSFVFLVVKSSNSFLSRLAAPAPPPRC